MNLLKTFLVITYFFIAVNAVDATVYPDWEGYPPMFTLTDVIEFNGGVYCTNEGGVFCYRDLPGLGDYEFFYRNHGLSANNALSIEATSRELYIGFNQHGLMRFDPENSIFEPVLFPEYVDKDDVSKTLSVNDIFAFNDSILYIGHANGIDRLDLTAEELRTYSRLSAFIAEDTSVHEVKIFHNKIWACTAEGLAWADIDNPNLESEEHWEYFKFDSGVNTIMNVSEINGNNIVYIGTNGNGIYAFDYIEKDSLATDVTDCTVYSIKKWKNDFIAVSDKGLYRTNGTNWQLLDDTHVDLRELSAGTEKLWIATSNDGLKCYTDSGYTDIPTITVPKSSTFRQITLSDDNVLWAATSYRDNRGYVQRFNKGIWTSYSIEDGLPSDTTTGMHYDNRGTLWSGTWSDGVYVLDDNGTQEKTDDIITPVDPDHEFIEPYTGSGTYYVTPDFAEDTRGNIWIAGWDRGIYLFEGKLPVRDYKYHHFLFDENETTHFIWRIVSDDDGWIWLGTWNTGILGYYIGDDPYDDSDDILHNIAKADDLLSNLVSALHVDQDGYVWAGTEGGLNRIEKISVNNLRVEDMNHILGFDTLEIMSIEGDRFNNKWIGTSEGLFKLNDDNDLLFHYTIDTSGLLSNNILSLKYDSSLDILWIGTDSGMNKFHVFGSDSANNTAKTHVYPNPYEIWGSNSEAVFTNLKLNTLLRIYTFTGDLVTELIADGDNGNDAVWNGRNIKGEYVGSGVFFYTGTDKDGRDFREKMVVIRR